MRRAACVLFVQLLLMLAGVERRRVGATRHTLYTLYPPRTHELSRWLKTECSHAESSLLTTVEHEWTDMHSLVA